MRRVTCCRGGRTSKFHVIARRVGGWVAGGSPVTGAECTPDERCGQTGDCHGPWQRLLSRTGPRAAVSICAGCDGDARRRWLAGGALYRATQSRASAEQIESPVGRLGPANGRSKGSRFGDEIPQSFVGAQHRCTESDFVVDRMRRKRPEDGAARQPLAERLRLARASN